MTGSDDKLFTSKSVASTTKLLPHDTKPRLAIAWLIHPFMRRLTIYYSLQLEHSMRSSRITSPCFHNPMPTAVLFLTKSLTATC